jgi:hypothetical protein
MQLFDLDEDGRKEIVVMDVGRDCLGAFSGGMGS